MKNLYLYIAILLLGVSNGFAQNLQNLQNAIWHFGNHAGLDFNNANSTTLPSALTTLPTSLGFNPLEGCASVSDQNGSLLFFTDGITVWRALSGGGFAQIFTGLLGGSSSAQNAIIVPKPDTPNHYYIFTINGITSEKKGLYYSEIDLSIGNGVIVSPPNIPLKDGAGTLINASYNNNSEAITSTKHPINSKYWVVAHVKGGNNVNQMLSYLVTSNGIVNQSPTFSLPFNMTIAFTTKISPDTNKIALTGTSGTFLGTFNNNTGIISMNSTNIYSGDGYGLEFSPDSSILYHTPYLVQGSIIGTDVNNISNQYIINTGQYYSWALQLGIDGKIYVATTNSTSLSTITNPNILNNPQYESFNVLLSDYHCQAGLPQWVYQQVKNECGDITGLMLNGENLQWDDIATSYVIEVVADGKCNIPETLGVDPFYGTLSLNDNFIPTSTLASLAGGNKEFRWRIRTICGNWSNWCCMDVNSVIPYPLPFPFGSCIYEPEPCNAEYNINITQEVFAAENNEEQAANILTASNIINSGATADYHAGIAVVLSDGFNAKSGSVFHGYIEECTSSANRMANDKSDKGTANITSAELNTTIRKSSDKGLKIYPNPSNSFTEISVENTKINYVSVSSMEGKVIFNKGIESNTSYLLDTSSFSKGIYILSVETNDGKIYSEKLIIN